MGPTMYHEPWCKSHSNGTAVECTCGVNRPYSDAYTSSHLLIWDDPDDIKKLKDEITLLKKLNQQLQQRLFAAERRR